MAKNPFFLLKSGNFFWHTLIIWGDQNFSVFTFLIWSKKVGKNGKNTLLRMSHQKCIFSIFTHFFCQIKNVKTEKKLSPQMIKVYFSVFTFLIWSKKVGKNGKNTLLRMSHQKCIFSIFTHFFCQIKNVKTEKKLSPQMIKVCQKKFPLFKIKNGFLAIFVILAKTRKWPKIHFFFGKVEIFFVTQNSGGETKIFQFLQF